MKQNKLIVGGLLVVVILIWGTVLLRFRELKNGDSLKGDAPDYAVSIENRIPVNTAYRLLLDYPDPFLKEWANSEIPQHTKKDNYSAKSPQIVGATEEDEELIVSRFERVKYYGYVGSVDRNQDYGFVEEEDQIFMVSEGDSLFDWRIILISNDSIVVVNGNASAVIHAF